VTHRVHNPEDRPLKIGLAGTGIVAASR
jgi:hypothetical protein